MAAAGWAAYEPWAASGGGGEGGGRGAVGEGKAGRDAVGVWFGERCEDEHIGVWKVGVR